MTVPTLYPHTLPWLHGIVPCQVVLDVGAGLRPMNLYRPARHICVEPFAPYCEALRAAGYEVLQETALAALTRGVPGVDAVFLLDVLEHMEKEEGRTILRLAQELAAVQVVVFTPHGFLPQSRDAWGWGGDAWQTHRSGWLPEEFPGWQITGIALSHRAFGAVWTRGGGTL